MTDERIFNCTGAYSINDVQHPWSYSRAKSLTGSFRNETVDIATINVRDDMRLVFDDATTITGAELKLILRLNIRLIKKEFPEEFI